MSGDADVTPTAFDLLARIGQESGRPLGAMLELSDRCNEVCVHCYQVQGQKGELTTGEWQQILDQLAEAGVLIVTLSGGEVTLRRDFLEIVAYARQRSFAVRIFTNGMTMTRELAQRLAELAVMDVEISMYSTRAEVHDFVTGVAGSFAKTVQGIRNLREQGVAVTIKTVAMSVNEAELSDYPRFAQALGATFRFDTDGVVPREGYDRSPQALNAQRVHIDQLKRELRAVGLDTGDDDFESAAQDLAASAPSERHKPAEANICGAGHNLHVEPNGELRPCALLEVNLGDVRERRVSERFASEEARALRALSWGDLHGCRVCELARFCGRCHAVALAETGDALGPYPSACAQARAALQAARRDQVRFVAGRSGSSSLGPYRLLAADVFEAFEAPVTAQDDALARRLGWARRPGGGGRPPDLAVRPGELVQIRRPGSRASQLVRVPGGHERAASQQSNFSTEHVRSPETAAHASVNHDQRFAPGGSEG